MIGSRARTDNAQGISQEAAQAFVTWGGYQALNVVNIFGGGNVYTFPAIGPGSMPIPGLNQFEQLVDMRYARPTAWAVQLYFQSNGRMLADESFHMLWDVNISVGKAVNRIQFETDFTVVTGAELQRVLINETIAAQTIQIVPSFLSLKFTTIGTRSNSFRWSAWVAPIVD